MDQGVRRLDAAAMDMCRVALGIVEAYWEYHLKPWDMVVGALILSLSPLYYTLHIQIIKTHSFSYTPTT